MPDDVSGFDDFLFREIYEYQGALGKISARKTAFEIAGLGYSPTLRQGWSYDALGRATVIGYPQCVADSEGHNPCADGGGDVPAPTRNALYDRQHR